MGEEDELWVSTGTRDPVKKGKVALQLPIYLKERQLHELVKYLVSEEALKGQDLDVQEQETFAEVKRLLQQYLKEADEGVQGQMRTVFELQNKTGVYETEGTGGREGKIANLRRPAREYISVGEIELGEGKKEPYICLNFLVAEIPTWGNLERILNKTHQQKYT